jgi:hypothetical protein
MQSESSSCARQWSLIFGLQYFVQVIVPIPGFGNNLKGYMPVEIVSRAKCLQPRQLTRATPPTYTSLDLDEGVPGYEEAMQLHLPPYVLHTMNGIFRLLTLQYLGHIGQSIMTMEMRRTAMSRRRTRDEYAEAR